MEETEYTINIFGTVIKVKKALICFGAVVALTGHTYKSGSSYSHGDTDGLVGNLLGTAGSGIATGAACSVGSLDHQGYRLYPHHLRI